MIKIKRNISEHSQGLCIFLAFLITCCPSSVRLPVCKLFTFLSSPPESPGQINQTWHKVSLGEGTQVCSNEGPRLFQEEIITKKAKVH